MGIWLTRRNTTSPCVSKNRKSIENKCAVPTADSDI